MLKLQAPSIAVLLTVGAAGAVAGCGSPNTLTDTDGNPLPTGVEPPPPRRQRSVTRPACPWTT